MRTLRVLDSDVSDKDRAEIQSTMLGPKVLNRAELQVVRSSQMVSGLPKKICEREW